MTHVADETRRTARRGFDVVTFEILRNRLSAINYEAAMALRMVSGSTVATEANDFNSAIMTASGDVVAVGSFSITKSVTMSAVVKDVLAHFGDNPGIHEGDGFLCNDPYVGLQHQNDVALVMPLFIDGTLVGWVGTEVHQVDVGGPLPGNTQIGARDMFGEAPAFSPIKIVEGGVIRADHERAYLGRSRTPTLLALDLRAMLAACNVLVERVRALARDRGLAVVTEAMEAVLDYVEDRFRARLASLPDGTWNLVNHVDFDGDIYPIRIAMSKRHDQMHFDFRGTARQAAAIINCTGVALQAAVSGYACAALSWDMPWSPSAAGRAITVTSEKGTVVDCQRPAGTSKASTAMVGPVGNSVCVLISQMLACHDESRAKAMASWQSSVLVEDVFGVRADGSPLGTSLLDGLSGAGGARTYADGIDTGGSQSSPAVRIANVETYELEIPVLYLWRREARDTGGAGRFRGGMGIEKAVTPHGVDEIGSMTAHCVGAHMPMSLGLMGGLPGSTHAMRVHRGSAVRGLLATGVLPATEDQLGGRVEVLDQIARTTLRTGDVYIARSMGGGGYGDPISRDPRAVARDLRDGLVSETVASGIYGVLAPGGVVDEVATRAQRQSIRADRVAQARPPRSQVAQPKGPGDPVLLMGEHMSMVGHANGWFITCRCGHPLAPAGQGLGGWLPHVVRRVQSLGPAHDPDDAGAGAFQIVQYICPNSDCAVLLDVTVTYQAATPPSTHRLVSADPARKESDHG